MGELERKEPSVVQRDIKRGQEFIYKTYLARELQGESGYPIPMTDKERFEGLLWVVKWLLDNGGLEFTDTYRPLESKKK